MKPIIGIIARPSVSEEGNQIFYIHTAVKNAIINSGGIPISILPTTTKEYNPNERDLNETNIKDMITIIDRCNGVIFQGGDEFYDYDLKTVTYTYNNDIPTLGICLGMQTMGYLFEGQIEDLDNHKVKGVPYAHSIILKRDSKLYQILKEEKFNVNSRHCSSLFTTKLDIVGVSLDNVIEAIEDKSKKFFIGLQWHPENMINYDELSVKIFKAFIDVCRGNNNEYQGNT